MKTIEELGGDAERAKQEYLNATRAYVAAVRTCQANERAHKYAKARAVRRLLGGEGEGATPQTNPATGRAHTPTSADDYVALDPEYAQVLRQEDDDALNKTMRECDLRHTQLAWEQAITLCRASVGAGL